jgi:predicted phage-related endonuclease
MKLENIEQGSQEWLDIRFTKITGSDAAIIMGNNPWKSREQLLQCKRGLIVEEINQKMLEGQRLEPIAREIYENMTDVEMKPSIHVGTCELESLDRVPELFMKEKYWEPLKYSWAMASVDGLSTDGYLLLEIKCGKKSYDQAKKGFIPDYYLDQIQHCLWLTGAEACDYMAFNQGKEPVYMRVEKNLNYISEMIEKEYEFYQEMIDGK